MYFTDMMVSMYYLIIEISPISIKCKQYYFSTFYNQQCNRSIPEALLFDLLIFHFHNHQYTYLHLEYNTHQSSQYIRYYLCKYCNQKCKANKIKVQSSQDNTIKDIYYHKYYQVVYSSHLNIICSFEYYYTNHINLCKINIVKWMQKYQQRFQFHMMQYKIYQLDLSNENHCNLYTLSH